MASLGICWKGISSGKSELKIALPESSWVVMKRFGWESPREDAGGTSIVYEGCCFGDIMSTIVESECQSQNS